MVKYGNRLLQGDKIWVISICMSMRSKTHAVIAKHNFLAKKETQDLNVPEIIQPQGGLINTE